MSSQGLAALQAARYASVVRHSAASSPLHWHRQLQKKSMQQAPPFHISISPQTNIAWLPALPNATHSVTYDAVRLRPVAQVEA